MREGVGAPIEALSDEEVERLRSYFDQQGRIELAVWVSHLEPGNEGTEPDHHSMLGIADDDYATGDPEAVLRGIQTEILLPGWVDIFPRSEVEALREFGHIVWELGERSTAGLDPLDFRFTWEPIPASADELETFARLLSDIPAVMRVECTLERLWKGDGEVESTTCLYVGCDESGWISHSPLMEVVHAWRESGLVSTPNTSSSLGLPADPRVQTAVLYEAE